MTLLTNLFAWTLAASVALASAGSSAPATGDAPVELRLGYFANVTHATAICGVEQGTFKAELGELATLKTFTFNAGPAAVEALLSGGLDATYIGPNPAINAYVKSKGKAVRVIAGATSGGAFLVVDSGVEKPEDLRGKKIASPQLGGTQDVALRAWLKGKGFKVELTGTSDVFVVPQENAQTLEQFRARNIAGGWVPEPWATRLVLEGGGKILVDERELWPQGQFVTTHLIVRTEFLEQHPDVVRALLRGHLAAEAALLAKPAEAQETVNAGIAKITGKRIGAEVIGGAWKNLQFTHDPLADTLVKSAKDAETIGLVQLEGVDVRGIYDLRLLNELLAGRGEPTIRTEAK
jgi:NitT/TauT family transport system substrate-binding protein